MLSSKKQLKGGENKMKDSKPKVRREEIEAEKPKKELKIEIVKVGKLEENTAGVCTIPYDCADQ
jgi:hypothetical protein